MWIFPSTCEVSALWESLKEDSFFVIQKSSLSLESSQQSKWSFASIVGTISSIINPPQYPFRLLLKNNPLKMLLPGDEAIIIAVSSNIQELLLNWDTIHENIPTLLEDRNDTIKYFMTFVNDLLGDHDHDHHHPSSSPTTSPQLRRHIMSFKQTFGIDDDNDRLLSANPLSICHSNDGKVYCKSLQGWFFISEDHLAHHSLLLGKESRWIIRMSQLISIKRVSESSNNSSFFLKLSKYIFIGNSIILEWREPMKEKRWTILSNLLGKDLAIYDSLIALKNFNNNSQNTLSNCIKQQTHHHQDHHRQHRLDLKESLRERKEIDLLERRFNLTNLYSVIHPFYSRGVKIDSFCGDFIVLEKYLIHSNDSFYTIIPISYILSIEEEEEGKEEKFIINIFVTGCENSIKVEFEDENSSHMLLDCQKRLYNSADAERKYFPGNGGGLGSIFGYFCDNDEDDAVEDIGNKDDLMKSPIIKHIFRKHPTHKVRGAFWDRMSGAFFSRIVEGVYIGGGERECENYNSNNSIEALLDIEKDIERTMPEYKGFQTNNGKESLRTILLWYSQFNKEIGYCQSMNLITAFLLIWCDPIITCNILHIICQKVLPLYFVRNEYSMEGAILDQHCLEKIIIRHLPILEQQLRERKINVALITLPILLSLGLAGANQNGSFSFKNLSLIWDLILFECHIAPLFRVILSLLKGIQRGISVANILDESSFIRIWKKEIESVRDWKGFIEESTNDWSEWVNKDIISDLREQNNLWVREEIRTFKVRRSIREGRNISDFSDDFLRKIFEHWDIYSSKGRFHLLLKNICASNWPTCRGVEMFILSGLFEINFQYDWTSFIKRLNFINNLNSQEIHELIFNYSIMFGESTNLQLTEIYLFLIPEESIEEDDVTYDSDDWEYQRITSVNEITKHDEFKSFIDFKEFIEKNQFIKRFFDKSSLLSLLLHKEELAKCIRKQPQNNKNYIPKEIETTPQLDILISLTKKNDLNHKVGGSMDTLLEEFSNL